MQRNLEQLTRELAAAEKELATRAAAVDRQKAALDRFLERFGHEWTATRAQLEAAKLEAESLLAGTKQRRDELLASIERQAPSARGAERRWEHGQLRPAPEQERAPDVELEIDL
jgi:hypothetical protein